MKQVFSNSNRLLITLIFSFLSLFPHKTSTKLMIRPASLADIAPEILANVFDFLETPDVVQCQLVCSKWGRVAQEQLYKDIDRSALSSTTKLNTFLNTINNSPSNPGAHVKSIDMHH